MKITVGIPSTAHKVHVHFGPKFSSLLNTHDASGLYSRPVELIRIDSPCVCQ